MLKAFSIIVAIVFFTSCGDSGKESNEMPVDSIKSSTVSDADLGSKLYNIPSPIETFTILKMSGAKFDKSLLNAANNIDKYVSIYSKSINLGVYSADLSFCLLYKENQDVNFYLKNVNELTTSLGIDGDFAQLVSQRLKANANNSDSILQIVSDASVDAYVYLKENQRNSTSVLITAGGWLEAMHFIIKMAETTQNKDIISLVASQRNVIKNLVIMLSKFESDAEIASLLTEIKDISAIYQTLKESKDKSAVASIDKKIVSIGNNKSYEISKEELSAIREKIELLRNKLTI